MARLKAGVGSAVITPPIGIEMGMWALRKGLSQGIHDHMLTRALVLDDGNAAVAIVSMDVCAISMDVTQQVRELVAGATGIAPGHILLNPSHTHTTPYTRRSKLSPGPDGLTAGHLAYLETFPHYVAGAIIEAWHNRQPASIGAASTDVTGITINRRDPTLSVDPELGVVRVDDADGFPLACLVNYACHGTAVGAHHLEWTGDFAGYLARAFEDAMPGCHCLFLQGAEGDIHPWDFYFGNENPRFEDDYEAAERLGVAIAGPALGLFQQIETRAEADIQVAGSTIALPPRPISWSVEEAEAYLAKVEVGVEPYRGAVIPDRCPGCMSAQRFPEAYALSGARHEARFARDYPDAIDAELTVARIGDIALASVPGEFFHELGMQVKQASPVKSTYVLGLTNDWMGYLPTRDAAEAVLDLPLEEFTNTVKYRQHYGATVTTEVGPQAGEMVRNELLRLIQTTVA
jgi:neutral ceramidase